MWEGARSRSFFVELASARFFIFSYLDGKQSGGDCRTDLLGLSRRRFVLLLLGLRLFYSELGDSAKKLHEMLPKTGQAALICQFWYGNPRLRVPVPRIRPSHFLRPSSISLMASRGSATSTIS